MRTTIEMAREAGIRDCTCDGARGCLDRLVELVRADERARMAEQRKPLTDEKVEKIIKGNMVLQMNLAGIRQDFEAAHGIKENT